MRGHACTLSFFQFVRLCGAKPRMSTAETAFVIVAVFLVLVIGNIVFSFLAERKNPPIGRLYRV